MTSGNRKSSSACDTWGLELLVLNPDGQERTGSVSLHTEGAGVFIAQGGLVSYWACHGVE